MSTQTLHVHPIKGVHGNSNIHVRPIKGVHGNSDTPCTPYSTVRGLSLLLPPIRPMRIDLLSRVIYDSHIPAIFPRMKREGPTKTIHVHPILL